MKKPRKKVLSAEGMERVRELPFDPTPLSVLGYYFAYLCGGGAFVRRKAPFYGSCTFRPSCVGERDEGACCVVGDGVCDAVGVVDEVADEEYERCMLQ